MHHHQRSVVLLTACALTMIASFAFGPAAHAAALGVQTSTSMVGEVRADLAWKTNDDDGFEATTDLTLRITRAGVEAVSGPLVVKNCEAPTCRPVPWTDAERSEALVRDVDADGEPEVLVYVFSGGAHCCASVVIYSWIDGRYVSRARGFADAGVVLADVERDGVSEFVSNDARFAYAFGSFAESLMPPQTFHFQHGAFVDVTRSYPYRIRKDAAYALKLARSQCRSTDEDARTLSFYAAWAADQYLLGNRAKALATLRKERARGCFKPAETSAAFLAKLDKFLKRLGYAKAGGPALASVDIQPE